LGGGQGQVPGTQKKKREIGGGSIKARSRYRVRILEVKVKLFPARVVVK